MPLVKTGAKVIVLYVVLSVLAAGIIVLVEVTTHAL
jgi:hypothetical protein